MSIEQDIKQKQFSSEKQKTLINLLYTYHHLVSKMADIFKPYKITRQQYNVLRILRGQYPKAATINLIKERMLDKMSDASRIVDRLYKKGWIDRNPSETDRRAVKVLISKKGLQILDTIEPRLLQFEEQQIVLSQKEANSLNILLDKIRIRK